MKTAASNYGSSRNRHLKIQNAIREKQRQKEALSKGYVPPNWGLLNPVNNGTESEGKLVLDNKSHADLSATFADYFPDALKEVVREKELTAEENQLMSDKNILETAFMLKAIPKTAPDSMGYDSFQKMVSSISDSVIRKGYVKSFTDALAERYVGSVEILSKYDFGNNQVGYVLRFLEGAPNNFGSMNISHLKKKGDGRSTEKPEHLYKKAVADAFDRIILSKENYCSTPNLSEDSYRAIVDEKMPDIAIVFKTLKSKKSKNMRY